MSSKKPIIVDLVYGIIATFQGQQILPDKPNLVWVFYTPFGKLKKLRYPEPVPKDAVQHVHNTRVDYEGVDESIVFITENAKGEKFVSDKLNTLKADTLKKMEMELEQKSMEAMTAKHRATTKSAESVKQLAQDRELKGKDDENRDKFMNPFGYRPRYLNEFNQPRNDED